MHDVQSATQWLPARPVHERYGRSKPWLERILRTDPSFPRPIYIGKNRYWSIDDLIAWERDRAASLPPKSRGAATQHQEATDARAA